MTDPAQNLTAQLLDSGDMAEDWAVAFNEARRELFLPSRIWPVDPGTGRHVSVSRDDDPEAWATWVYSNVPITTQWDDGDHHGPEPGLVPTSSSSMPSLVAAMFKDLLVTEGHSVLEVGTGTGWTSALLSARLNDIDVISLEVDPTVASAARQAINRKGWRPQIVAVDGTQGWPVGAPYNRVLVTAGVRGPIPAAWIEQTLSGGVIVVPWGPQLTSQDAIVQLVVGPDGQATGRFTRSAEFMKIRTQRIPWPKHSDYVPAEFPDDARESATKLTEPVLTHTPWDPAEFVIGLMVEDCVYSSAPNADGTSALWLYGLTDLSWAAVMRCADDCGEFEVYQAGPRSLWDEVEIAYRWWDANGRPEVTAFGMTVSHEEQFTWFESPNRRFS